MSAETKNITIRFPGKMAAKLEDTVYLLVQADKLREHGGQSDFIRHVVDGACDEILQTPVESVDRILPPGEERPDLPELGCEMALLCTKWPHGCPSCPHHTERKNWKKVFEDLHAEQEGGGNDGGQ